jgi:protein gp37
MSRARQHSFQVLTKRSERLEELGKVLPWPGNVWIGVSVESAAYAYRIEHLRHVPASTRFVSFEPLLADAGKLDLTDIHWAIVGGESGPGARPMQPDWAPALRDQCVRQSVPFFFKQWGGVQKKKAGRLLDGRVWDEYPTAHVPAAAGTTRR